MNRLIQVIVIITACLLVGCKGPAPNLQSTPLLQSANIRIIPDEARQLLRPNTQDRIEWLSRPGHSDSWMVIHNPPIEVDDNTNFSVNYFRATLPSGNISPSTQLCQVATLQQPANISHELYVQWYSRPVYEQGGRKVHPDPWIRDDNCPGNYSITIHAGNSIDSSEETSATSIIPEHRYALSPPGWTPPYFMSNRLIAHPEMGTNTVAIPCHTAHDFDAVISKSEACDGSSPAISPLAFSQKPFTPSATPSPFCPRHLQRERLDKIEQQLWQTSSLLHNLAKQTDNESLFQTQGHTPSPGPYPSPIAPANLFQVSAAVENPRPVEPTSTPSSQASSSGSSGTTPPYDSAQIYKDQIPIENVEYQLEEIKKLLTGLQQQLQSVRLEILPVGAEITDERQVIETVLKNLEEQIQSSQRSLIKFRSEYKWMCGEKQEGENIPTLDLIYAGFESDGSIIIKGRAFEAPSELAISEIQPDFSGDIELTDPNIIADWDDPLSKRFTIAIPPNKYIFSDIFMVKIGADMQASQGANPLEQLQIKLTAGSFQIQSNQNRLYPSQTEYLIGNPLIVWQTANMPYPPLETLGEWGSCHRMMYVYQRMSFLMDLIGVDAERVLAGNLPEQSLLIERSSDMRNYLSELLILRQLSQQNAKYCSQLGNSAIEFERDIPDEFSITALPALVPLAGTIALISPQIQPVLQRAITWAAASIAIYTGYEAISENDNSPVALAFYRDRVLTPHMLMGKSLGTFWSEETGTNELWKNLRKGGQLTDIPDWEVGDHAHHIIQQSQTELVEAHAAVRSCFPPPDPSGNWQPSQWNRSGIHSGANGVPLQEWFHSKMHDPPSRPNMNRFIDTIMSGSSEDSQDCDFGPGGNCAKMEEFLEHRIKPYLAKLNHKYKEALEEVVMQMINSSANANNPEIKKIREVINNPNHPKYKQFMRADGPRQGKFEINRILNNKRWPGDKSIGFSDTQRSQVHSIMRDKITRGEIKLPKYVTTDGMTLNEICKEINEEMSK